MPDPVLHLADRAMGVATGPAALEPDPRASGACVLLDAALQAATGLHSSWPSGVTAPPSPPRRGGPAATAGLTSAAAGLGEAAEALYGLIDLAEITGRSGRTGKTDLS